MYTYADACWRMLTHAKMESLNIMPVSKLTYATTYADAC